jgi:hypothetical protein
MSSSPVLILICKEIPFLKQYACHLIGCKTFRRYQSKCCKKGYNYGSFPLLGQLGGYYVVMKTT